MPFWKMRDDEQRIDASLVGKYVFGERRMGNGLGYYDPEEIVVDEVKGEYFRYHLHERLLSSWRRWCRVKDFRILALSESVPKDLIELEKNSWTDRD